MSYILTKFFAQKEYQQAFVRGDFYLSSLSAFTKVCVGGQRDTQ